MKTKIGILGMGHFGTAMMCYLNNNQENNCQLMGFDHKQNLCHFLNYYHYHPHFFQNSPFNKNIIFTTSYQKLISQNNIIVLAIASQVLPLVLKEIKPFIKRKIIFISLIKALNNHTGETPSQLIKKIYPHSPYVQTAVLVGGTMANELIEDKILGMNLACQDKQTGQLLKQLLHSRHLKIHQTNDVLGCEYASCFKNIISVFAGILKGMKFPYGSITYVISQMAGEIKNICLEQLKCQKETFDIDSQVFSNDLWMSATSLSRNCQFGLLVGQGLSPQKALQQLQQQNQTVESINTLKTMQKIVDLKNYPFTNFLTKIIDENLDLNSIKAFLYQL